jgi:hypothetical protein
MRVFFVPPAGDFLECELPDGLPPFVYSAPVPYAITSAGIEFILGPFPPATFSLEIALPPALPGFFRVEAIYANGSTDTRDVR